MIHTLGFINRRPDMSLADFAQYWRTTHLDLVLEFRDPLPIQGCVQNHRLVVEPANMESDFDGAPELWINSMAGLGELIQSPKFQYISDVDSLNFIRMPPLALMITEPAVDYGKSRSQVAGTVRLMRVFRRPTHISNFEEMWLNQATPISLSTADPLKLTRQMVLSAPEEANDPAAFFGIECSWWPDEDALSTAWSNRDEAFDTVSLMLIAREEVAMAPLIDNWAPRPGAGL